MSDTHESPPPSARDLQARIEAERAGVPFLLWRDASGHQHIRRLTGEQRVTVGRREHSDVPLTWDNEVSRTHALIECVGDTWTVVDDGLSRNGSFVNGSRVHGRQRLHHRDQMCFGKTYVAYHEPAAEPGSESTARAPGAPNSIPLSEGRRKVLIALCRPVFTLGSAVPATNPQIAKEVNLSVDAVKGHLRLLFDQFGLGDLAQNEKRSRLVAIVREAEILRPHDF